MERGRLTVGVSRDNLLSRKSTAGLGSTAAHSHRRVGVGLKILHGEKGEICELREILRWHLDFETSDVETGEFRFVPVEGGRGRSFAGFGHVLWLRGV